MNHHNTAVMVSHQTCWLFIQICITNALPLEWLYEYQPILHFEQVWNKSRDVGSLVFLLWISKQ